MRDAQAVPDFTVRGALRCAEGGRLAGWVNAFLNTGEGFHRRLAAWFDREERFWFGPVNLPLSRLIRRYGPEEAMPWKEARADWERRVTAILDAYADPDAMPPMIARGLREQPDAFRLLLNDGAHRHEALSRLGAETGWVILWFDSAAHRREFIINQAG